MDAKKVTRNALLSAGIFLIAIALSIVFQQLGVEEHITTTFVFAVFLISLLTDGCAYGVASALGGVLAVNYAFTYPYFSLDFNIPVNLISAIIMTAVSILTGMLTTKIKKYEAEKARSQRECMRANLLRAVSHDLRTPLTAIYSAGSTLRNKRGLLTEEQQDTMLKNIEEDAEWLMRMVENLLSITRIDNGQIRIEKTAVILDELIDSVMTKFLNRHPGQKVEISLPDEITVLSIDPILIEQVMMNLLENAVFHARNMTRIIFRSFTLGQKVIFEIADDGCGIPRERLKDLFDGPGRAEDGASGGNKRNAGIGLSVCATIIRAHDGEITAENRREGGALFRFTLGKDAAAYDEQ